MSSGRVLVGVILGVTAIFAAALWYFVTRAYYTPVADAEITVQLPDGALVAIETDPEGVQAIVSESSPLGFRACFQAAPEASATLMADAMAYAEPAPTIAPAWFDCYDAEALGIDLEAGAATAVLSHRNITRGFDRVVALYPDGRGFAWHQINDTFE